MPLKLNFSKSYAWVEVPKPVVNDVKLPDVVPLCISPPLATIICPLNIIEQSTVKLELLDFFKNRKLNKKPIDRKTTV